MPPTSKDDAVASCGKMDTANNVDAYHIMQSELLTEHCTLRTGLENDDDISTNDSVVEQLTYSNGLLQNLRLRETGDITQAPPCIANPTNQYHHIPGAGTLSSSQELLFEYADIKERMAKECRSKEKIIRLILKNEYLAASDLYNLTCDEKGMPSKLWSDEISAYVRDHLRDPEMVEIYFPNLPPRPLSTNDLDILNSDKCEEEAEEARWKIESLCIQKFSESSHES